MVVVAWQRVSECHTKSVERMHRSKVGDGYTVALRAHRLARRSTGETTMQSRLLRYRAPLRVPGEHSSNSVDPMMSIMQGSVDQLTIRLPVQP